MADDSFLGGWDGRFGHGRGRAPAADDNLPIRPAKFIEPSLIPPRQWLYGVDILRGHITVVVAPGGVGKTSLSIAWAMEIASGGRAVPSATPGKFYNRGFLGERVWVRMPVLVCSLEDPADETDRRIAACRIQHAVTADDLDQMLFTYHADERRLMIATKTIDGIEIATPDVEPMIQIVNDLGIGAIFVDPFVNCHGLEENSNDEMNQVAVAWKRIARETNCAVILVHHTRKGAGVADIEGGRGAKALTDAARVGLTLSAMTSEEAAGYGISEAARRSYIRLDNAKLNLSPADKARWFQLVSVELHNGDDVYESGDRVQAIVRWMPPDAWGDATPAELNAVLDDIDAGLEGGSRYAPTHPKSPRWAGHVLMNALGWEEERAAKLISVWVKSGTLIVEKYQDQRLRAELNGVRVNASKRPDV